MGVEEEAVAATGVNGAAAFIGRDAGDGAGKIGIDGEFDIGGSIRDADKGVGGSNEIGRELLGRFAPSIILGNGVGDLVEPPEPVVNAVLGDLGFGFPDRFGAGAGENLLGFVGSEGFDDPAASGVGWGPGGPWFVAAFGG